MLDSLFNCPNVPLCLVAFFSLNFGSLYSHGSNKNSESRACFLCSFFFVLTTHAPTGNHFQLNETQSSLCLNLLNCSSCCTELCFVFSVHCSRINDFLFETCFLMNLRFWFMLCLADRPLCSQCCFLRRLAYILKCEVFLLALYIQAACQLLRETVFFYIPLRCAAADGVH